MKCPKCGYRRWVTDGPVKIAWLTGPCPNDGEKLVLAVPKEV